MHKVVKRPFLTSRTIAWRLTPLIWAASACETHCSALGQAFLQPTDGHNLLEFDIPFIRQRSWILGIKPTRHIDCRKDTAKTSSTLCSSGQTGVSANS